MPIDQELVTKLRENTEVNMKIRKNKETVDKSVKGGTDEGCDG